jgi:predicted  nucleic acid-binding Zn-ribbon protein
MKATQNQQQDLLHLHTLETEIKRKRAAIQAISQSAELVALRSAQMLQATALITAHNAVEATELELKRADTDLQLVVDRISRDQVRLQNTASPKDAQGIQSELESLSKRQSDLEDATLFVMERLEALKAEYEALNTEKASTDAALAALESSGEAEILKLTSGGELLVQEHRALKSRIEPQLLELYEKLASRGVPIGRLEGRECGACRMAMGANAFETLSKLSIDEFARCPDCQALLVR